MSKKNVSLLVFVILVVTLLATACGPEKVPDAQFWEVNDSVTIEGVTVTLTATAEGALCSFLTFTKTSNFSIKGGSFSLV